MEFLNDLQSFDIFPSPLRGRKNGADAHFAHEPQRKYQGGKLSTCDISQLPSWPGGVMQDSASFKSIARYTGGKVGLTLPRRANLLTSPGEPQT